MKAREDLGMREAVFRLLRLPHDETAFTQLAGIISDRNDLGYSTALVEKVDVADIIEIDGGAERSRLDKLVSGRVVRGEHDLPADDARSLREDQFGQGTAIGAESLGMKDFQNEGIGRGLDGKKLLEPGIPGEQIQQAAGVRANRAFVVDVERRRIGAQSPLIGCGKMGASCRSFVR